MNQPARPDIAPSYSAHVFAAADLTVDSGVNAGDGLTPLAELCLGDSYMLTQGARAMELAIRDRRAMRLGNDRFMQSGGRAKKVAAGSEIGAPGDLLTLDGRLTLLAPGGEKVDLLLIALHHSGGGAPLLYFLPLAPIMPKVPHTLVAMTDDPGDVRLTDITPVAFSRGTAIMLADGSQRPVEALRPGDMLLTRDHGAQPLRWIGSRIVRAIGPFAPVVICKGALANDRDLIVSQHQRLFIYQRGPDRLTDQAELLLKARDLIDDDMVFIRAGGVVEYFHLVLDQHEIIYAECTPTESLLINERSLGRLPEEMARDVAAHLRGLSQPPHVGAEADKALLSRIPAADLRRAARPG